jgi:hypothetical protein
VCRSTLRGGAPVPPFRFVFVPKPVQAAPACAGTRSWAGALRPPDVAAALSRTQQLVVSLVALARGAGISSLRRALRRRSHGQECLLIAQTAST